MKKQLLTLFALLLIVPAFAQPKKADVVKNVREGNKAYKNGDFEGAGVSYRRALEADAASFDASYNLANTEYKQSNFAEAGKRYTAIAAATNDKSKKADNFYNLGNSLLSEKKYKESIDAYKNALKLNPDDMDAKSNLAYAQKKLEKDQQGGGGQNNQQDKQDDQKGEQDKQDKQGKQDQQDQKPDPQDGDGQQQPNQPKLSPKEAEQLLEAIQADERETQEKLNKEKARILRQQKVEKNW